MNSELIFQGTKTNADLCCIRFLLTPSFGKKEGFPAIFHAIAAPVNGDDLGMMQEPVEQGGGQDLILECVIMPLSFIVLLVEAILGAVYYLLPSSIPSRTSLCLPSTTCERS